MARVTTKTGVANLAITLLKGNPVTSIEPPDKGSKAAKLAAQWYDDARREALSETDWDFALKRVQISASAAPAFGWSASYQVPSDFIRISTIGDENNRTGPDQRALCVRHRGRDKIQPQIPDGLCKKTIILYLGRDHRVSEHVRRAWGTGRRRHGQRQDA